MAFVSVEKKAELMNTQATTARPLRVLQCIGDAFDYGGVETWVLQVVRNIKRSRYQIDVLKAVDREGAYDDEAIALGARVIPCQWRGNPLNFSHRVREIMDEYGPYDIVHVHPFARGAALMYLAWQAGVPMRVFHCRGTGLGKRAGRRLWQWLIRRYATSILAVTANSATNYLGPSILEDKRYRWLPSGIDLSAFAEPPDCHLMRQSLGIPEQANVVGHVGQFVTVKNHEFIVDVAAALAPQCPEVYFLLVGDGENRGRIEQKVRQLGLTGRVIFAGNRSDVPAIMRCAMDLFLFPSWHEGMGRVVVEGQAAGLPCVISDTIPREVDLVKPLVKRLSLSEPAAIWAQEIGALLKGQPAVSPEQALAVAQQSELSMGQNVRVLEALYATCRPIS